MSSSKFALITVDWADGTYPFRIGLAEWEEIEKKHDTSLFVILARMSPAAREPRLLEIMDVLRLGLIGAGMESVKALQLVRRYVDERPADYNRDVAYSILLAALERAHGDDLEQGESEAPEKSSD